MYYAYSETCLFGHLYKRVFCHLSKSPSTLQVTILRSLSNAASGQTSWNGACTFALRINLHILANEEIKGALFWRTKSPKSEN